MATGKGPAPTLGHGLLPAGGRQVGSVPSTEVKLYQLLLEICTSRYRIHSRHLHFEILKQVKYILGGPTLNFQKTNLILVITTTAANF